MATVQFTMETSLRAVVVAQCALTPMQLQSLGTPSLLPCYAHGNIVFRKETSLSSVVVDVQALHDAQNRGYTALQKHQRSVEQI